nr:MAG TPA: Minor structural protein 4 [Caudoviricetes sp.]
MQLHFNSTYIDVLPTDESYRYRSIMGEHTLNIYFSLSTYTDIPTGAWCEFQGERYTLNQPAKVVKHNSRHFEYTLTMDSEGANLKNYKFRNPNDKTLKFPFTASPHYHIQILVDCLNMIDSGWQVGTTIEANEKLISYNHNNCLEALDMIAKAFETEYEIIGKTIHLHKVEYFKDNPLPLQYGKGKGFKTGVSRTTEQSRITRLYVQGGERNIDRSKYGNKELLLPKSQEYVYEGVTFVADDKGLSITIKNAQNNGFINEQSLDLSHIYPSRKGTISAVFEVDRDKHFYDFADTTIPEALNFADLQIKGEKMVIYFESGILSGREFEVSKYDHTKKRFQLVPKEEDGTTMPNDIFKPAIGDQYSVYNMHLPAAYICDDNTKTGASWEMMKEACKYLYENRADLFTFTGDLDGIWAKKRWVNVGGRLKMGAYIHFSDTEFQRTPVAIRIVGLKEYVNNPYSPQIELSNKVQGQSFSSEIRKLQNQEVYFGEMNKQTQSLTKRSWRNALETIKQVEEAFPEYTQSIIPATVQTMMALVGNKSGQFAFVANKTNPITVPHTLYFDRNNKQINAGSGWIKHYTLGTTDIKPSHSAADYKYWYVSPFVSGRLDDKAKSYYLYIKANKAIETAEFVLSENKIDMEQEAGFYHFLYATVNSEYDGERGIAQFNGFTEITGGQMVTNRIASGNGEQFIALYDDRIEINAHLQISDRNKLEFKQLVNPDLQSLESRLKQYSNEQMDNIQVGGKNLLRNSKQRITNSNYNIATYHLTEELRDGDVVTLTIKGHLGAGKLVFAAYNSGDFLELSQLFDKGNGIYQNTFNWRKVINGRTADNKTLWIWTYDGSVSVDSTIEWIKLERGNKPTDWSPAPEDVESKIDNEKQNREQAVANAKSATEAYARAQADLLKLQAIAEANRNAGLAITAEQQARIQEAQRNLQIAKTHAEQKVNDLNIGAKNLLRNSRQLITNNYYNIATYHLTEELKIGDLLTITIKGQLGVGKTAFAIYDQFGSIEQCALFDKGVGIYQNTFNYRGYRSGDKMILTVWTYPSSVDVNSTIEWIKLERGNKPTDWSPAPEDVENQIANINSDLEIIRKNAERIEDLENQNKAKTDERIGKLDQKTAFLNDTQIAGNVVATGTMIVGNTTGTQAGITGVGNATNEVRFWAGSEFAGRYAAPYRVLQDGSLYASKGQIGNFKIESASDTSLIANGLTVASNGIIKAFGSATNRSTQVIINDPGQLQELVGTRPVASIYSSGFEDTSHTALHLTSRGGRYNAALVLESENGANGSTALDIIKGDIYVKGQKGINGSFTIYGSGYTYNITITNGLITNLVVTDFGTQ